MRRLAGAALLLLLTCACREQALAEGHERDPNLAVCAARAESKILVNYHHGWFSLGRTLKQLRHVRELVQANATGAHGPELRAYAAAIRVYEATLLDSGDRGVAARDIKYLRESLPPCRRTPSVLRAGLPTPIPGRAPSRLPHHRPL